MIIALFFEVGTVLLVVPWVPYWEQNYFIYARPYVQPIMTSNFVRGAISGLGLVNLFAGVAELASLFLTRRARRDADRRPEFGEQAGSEESPGAGAPR